MKEAVLEKAQRRLQYNAPDYLFDEDLLGDYFDDAVSIIKKWRKLTDDSEFNNGDYDSNIVQFIIESIGVAGSEGQSSVSGNGTTKSFINTPESNLKSAIPQRL